MKLRLAGNSIRVRLSEAEAAEWEQNKRVEEQVEMTAGLPFIYALERTPAVSDIAASLGGHALLISVPESMAKQWLASGAEGLYSKTIAIERDLPCKHSQ